VVAETISTNGDDFSRWSDMQALKEAFTASTLENPRPLWPETQSPAPQDYWLAIILWENRTEQRDSTTKRVRYRLSEA